MLAALPEPLPDVQPVEPRQVAEGAQAQPPQQRGELGEAELGDRQRGEEGGEPPGGTTRTRGAVCAMPVERAACSAANGPSAIPIRTSPSASPSSSSSASRQRSSSAAAASSPP